MGSRVVHPPSASSALLSAVLESPESDAPRLVYADLLQQHGDPRGEFIAVQCALAKLGETARTRKALEARERALLDEHAETWSAVAPVGKLTFTRGFASAWRVPPGDFAKQAAVVFAAEPIRTLDISQAQAFDPLPPNAMAAFTRPELARITRLEMRRLRLPAADFPKVAACPHLAELRELDLTYARLSWNAVVALTARPTFTKLAWLRIQGKPDARFPEAVAASPFAATLRWLDVSKSGIGQDGVVALARLPALAGLRSLDLTRCKLRDTAANALADSTTLTGLERLVLEENTFSPAAQKRLRARYGKALQL